jgi:uncharacterized protein (DUF1499 family)
MVKGFLVAVALVGALAALALLAAQWGAFHGQPPTDLGVREGRLKAPSNTANSVSSQAELWPGHPMRDGARTAPLALRGSGEATLDRIDAIVQGMPGSTRVERRPDYLRVQFTTRWMRFVDDAEFWFDPVKGVIQIRSASRLGREDFGVNRARIESIRQALGEPR